MLLRCSNYHWPEKKQTLETESEYRRAVSILLHCFKSASRAADSHTENPISSKQILAYKWAVSIIGLYLSSMRQMTPCGAVNHQYQPFGQIHCYQTTSETSSLQQRIREWLNVNDIHNLRLGRLKVQKSFYLLYFSNILEVIVAYMCTAAPSTDGQTCLPFCTSHTHGWLSLFVPVSSCLSRSHKEKKIRRHAFAGGVGTVLQRRAAPF